VLGDRAQRIPGDDLRELGARADDDVDPEPEAVLELPLALARDAFGALPAREDDVPALQVGPDVSEPRLLEQLAQRRHRDPVPRTDVDAPEEHDAAR